MSWLDLVHAQHSTLQLFTYLLRSIKTVHKEIPNTIKKNPTITNIVHSAIPHATGRCIAINIPATMITKPPSTNRNQDFAMQAFEKKPVVISRYFFSVKLCRITVFLPSV